jgi:hypothetical protein
MRGKQAKDESVFRMLQSEQDRCTRVIDKLRVEIDKLPRGSLGQRKVKRGGKEYVYPCLKFRDGAHVKFVHVPPQQAETVRAGIEKRKKLQNDLKANKRRLNTISLIIKKG